MIKGCTSVERHIHVITIIMNFIMQSQPTPSLFIFDLITNNDKAQTIRAKRGHEHVEQTDSLDKFRWELKRATIESIIYIHIDASDNGQHKLCVSFNRAPPIPPGFMPDMPPDASVGDEPIFYTQISQLYLYTNMFLIFLVCTRESALSFCWGGVYPKPKVFVIVSLFPWCVIIVELEFLGTVLCS